ncbi:hypothetical protein J2X46_001703 [Nocardioides sp. BE266]|uniref:hypothetical protein n=1 Tax=Nocardioides sp. BE266 TaxID=2817725 RepID=UPI00285CED4F|nr:hypothetical protein [Nocardioides sp. BE266]MDR7252727.1 hypothetical protein [Nocardioides sp. BE266]
MLRTRSLVTSLALLTGLLLPLAATESVAAPPSDPVRRSVAYGDGSVKVPAGRRAAISFEGRKGDLVSLDDNAALPARLYRAGHKVPKTWGAGGLWKLPRTGRFTFRAPTYSADRRVGLLKARVHEVAVDGRRVRTPRARRGYIDLAAFDLDRGDRVTVDDGRFDKRIYYRNGTSDAFRGNLLLVRTGHAARTNDGGYTGRAKVRPGTVLVRVRSGYRVSVAAATKIATTPDGAAVSLTPAHALAREYAFTFTGTAGQLVYLEQTDGSALPSYYQVLNRFGAEVQPTHGSQDFLLPADGTYELSLVTEEISAADPATLRLRLGVRLGDLVPDGAPTTFALDGSGSHLYSLATGAGIRLEATPSDLGPSEYWTLGMGPRHITTCSPDSADSLGCGEYPAINLSYDLTSANSWNLLPLANDAVAVVAPAPGATGSLSVRLRTTTTP